MSVDKKECHPTAVSQSLADSLPSTSVPNASNFWDIFVLQQQQKMLLYEAINKSTDIASATVAPEALSTTVNASGLEFHDLPTAPVFGSSFYSYFMPFCQYNIIKEDVFLAQPSVLDTDIDDNASLSSSHSTQQMDTSPCSSPTNFLHDNEPLFGIIGTNETMDCQDEQHDDDTSLKQPKCLFSTSEDIDWLKLFEAFSADVDDDDDDDDDDNDDDNADNADNADRLSLSKENRIPITSNERKSIKKIKSLTTQKATSSQQRKYVKKNCKNLVQNKVKPVASDRTLFRQLTDAGIDWCRYCGTTEDKNWRPGPWGKNTLCNKHGCNYYGYGLPDRVNTLDLSSFLTESRQDRIRPIVQEFCVVCTLPDQLISCQGGCSFSYHRECHPPLQKIKSTKRWYCSELCNENRKLKIVVGLLPHHHNPFKQTPQRKRKNKIAK